MTSSTITTFPTSSVELISVNSDHDAIAFHAVSGRYYMGGIEGDDFINVFNIKLKQGRDDSAAITYFSEKFGFEADA